MAMSFRAQDRSTSYVAMTSTRATVTATLALAGVGSFSFFLAAWVPMMAAMMLPGAVPAVSRFVRTSGRALAAPLFAGSYLAVWALFGLAVYALYEPHGSTAAGALTIAAGLYELTPLKLD